MKKLLNFEIWDTNFHLLFLKMLLKKIDKDISTTTLDSSTKKKIFFFSQKKFNSILSNHNFIHQEKFTSLLSKKNNLTLSYKDTFVKNLSEVQLPSEVIDTVSLGSNFSVPSKISEQQIIDIVKNVETSLQLWDINNDVTNEIRKITPKNVNNFIKKEFHISKEDNKISKNLKITKKFLNDNPDIFFTKADKGNVTVCLKRSEYIIKMNNFLSDTSTYISIDKNPLRKLQEKTSKILKNLNDNEFLK